MPLAPGATVVDTVEQLAFASENRQRNRLKPRKTPTRLLPLLKVSGHIYTKRRRETPETLALSPCGPLLYSGSVNPLYLAFSEMASRLRSRPSSFRPALLPLFLSSFLSCRFVRIVKELVAGVGG